MPLLIQDERILDVNYALKEVDEIVDISFIDRTRKLWLRGIACDVHFFIGSRQTCFPAHSVILAARSLYFRERLFTTEKVAMGVSVEPQRVYILDMREDIFEEILNFMYSTQKDPNILKNNMILHLLHAGEKFKIEALKRACLMRLRNMTAENCLLILNQALLYKEMVIIEKCLRIADEKSDNILRSEGLLDCDRDTLKIVIDRESFRPSNEFRLFMALLSWSIVECERQHMDITSSNQRVVLGELLALVKLHALSDAEKEDVARTGLLPDAQNLCRSQSQTMGETVKAEELKEVSKSLDNVNDFPKEHEKENVESARARRLREANAMVRELELMLSGGKNEKKSNKPADIVKDRAEQVSAKKKLPATTVKSSKNETFEKQNWEKIATGEDIPTISKKTSKNSDTDMQPRQREDKFVKPESPVKVPPRIAITSPSEDVPSDIQIPKPSTSTSFTHEDSGSVMLKETAEEVAGKPPVAPKRVSKLRSNEAAIESKSEDVNCTTGKESDKKRMTEIPEKRDTQTHQSEILNEEVFKGKPRFQFKLQHDDEMSKVNYREPKKVEKYETPLESAIPILESDAKKIEGKKSSTVTPSEVKFKAAEEVKESESVNANETPLQVRSDARDGEKVRKLAQQFEHKVSSNVAQKEEHSVEESKLTKDNNDTQLTTKVVQTFTESPNDGSLNHKKPESLPAVLENRGVPKSLVNEHKKQNTESRKKEIPVSEIPEKEIPNSKVSPPSEQLSTDAVKDERWRAGMESEMESKTQPFEPKFSKIKKMKAVEETQNNLNKSSDKINRTRTSIENSESVEVTSPDPSVKLTSPDSGPGLSRTTKIPKINSVSGNQPRERSQKSVLDESSKKENFSSAIPSKETGEIDYRKNKKSEPFQRRSSVRKSLRDESLKLQIAEALRQKESRIEKTPEKELEVASVDVKEHEKEIKVVSRDVEEQGAMRPTEKYTEAEAFTPTDPKLPTKPEFIDLGIMEKTGTLDSSELTKKEKMKKKSSLLRALRLKSHSKVEDQKSSKSDFDVTPHDDAISPSRLKTLKQEKLGTNGVCTSEPQRPLATKAESKFSKALKTLTGKSTKSHSVSAASPDTEQPESSNFKENQLEPKSVRHEEKGQRSQSSWAESASKTSTDDQKISTAEFAAFKEGSSSISQEAKRMFDELETKYESEQQKEVSSKKKSPRAPQTPPNEEPAFVRRNWSLRQPKVGRLPRIVERREEPDAPLTTKMLKMSKTCSDLPSMETQLNPPPSSWTDAAFALSDKPTIEVTKAITSEEREKVAKQYQGVSMRSEKVDSIADQLTLSEKLQRRNALIAELEALHAKSVWEAPPDDEETAGNFTAKRSMTRAEAMQAASRIVDEYHSDDSPSTSLKPLQRRVSERRSFYVKSKEATERVFGTTNMANSVADGKPLSVITIKQNLLKWCQWAVRDYPVEISNFSTSWANGMAFCALAHRFASNSTRFDFDTLDPNDVRHNLEIAFSVAEANGVVPLLEVDDMLLMGNKPDWKCVFVYVQSIQRRFKDRA